MDRARPHMPGRFRNVSHDASAPAQARISHGRRSHSHGEPTVPHRALSASHRKPASLGLRLENARVSHSHRDLHSSSDFFALFSRSKARSAHAFRGCTQLRNWSRRKRLSGGCLSQVSSNQSGGKPGTNASPKTRSHSGTDSVSQGFQNLPR